MMGAVERKIVVAGCAACPYRNIDREYEVFAELPADRASTEVYFEAI